MAQLRSGPGAWAKGGGANEDAVAVLLLVLALVPGACGGRAGNISANVLCVAPLPSAVGLRGSSLLAVQMVGRMIPPTMAPSCGATPACRASTSAGATADACGW